MNKKSYRQTNDKISKSYNDSLLLKLDSNSIKDIQQNTIRQDYFVKDLYYETNWGENTFNRILTLSQEQASKIKFIPIIKLSDASQFQVNSMNVDVDYDLEIETKIIRRNLEDNDSNIYKYQVYCNMTANPSYKYQFITYYNLEYDIKILVCIQNDKVYNEYKKQKK